jgi:LmbE family N-acetylglucosaminyl deacetylase
VFVGAHPDDIEIGCAGTVCTFLAAGYDVLCVFLTRGERGGDSATREQESRQACREMGVPRQNVFFGCFPDTGIQDNQEVVSFLEGFCNRNTYAVFIPSVHETHQDHRHAAGAAWAAFRHAPRVLAYESPSTTADFHPSTFVDISACLQCKWLALRCHRSQIQRQTMYLDYRSMVALAEFRGRQTGVRYAEAFETVRLRLQPVPVAKPPRRPGDAGLRRHEGRSRQRRFRIDA